MNVTVILSDKQIVENCEEAELCGEVNSSPVHQLLFVNAVLTGVLRVQLN
jgi:hypothetical protein